MFGMGLWRVGDPALPLKPSEGEGNHPVPPLRDCVVMEGEEGAFVVAAFRLRFYRAMLQRKLKLAATNSIEITL
jgi:hypothetical protein